MVLRLEPGERVECRVGLDGLGNLGAKRHDGGQRTLHWQPQHDQNNGKQAASGLHLTSMGVFPMKSKQPLIKNKE